jgi:hypothetical protein
LALRPSRRSPRSLGFLSSTAGFDFCSSLLLNKPVNQPQTPVLASAVLATGFVLRAWAGAWALTGAAGLGM